MESLRGGPIEDPQSTTAINLNQQSTAFNLQFPKSSVLATSSAKLPLEEGYVASNRVESNVGMNHFAKDTASCELAAQDSFLDRDEPNDAPNDNFVTPEHRDLNDWESSKRIQISAAFLKDYEAYQPATLYYIFSQITDTQLYVHTLRSSSAWFVVLFLFSFFLAATSWVSLFDTHHDIKLFWRVVACLLSTIVFSLDIAAKAFTRKPGHPQDSGNDQLSSNTATFVPRSPSRVTTILLALYLVVYFITTIVDTIRRRETFFWIGVSTPVVWYYMFQTARDALEANFRIMLQMTRLIVFKLFLIFIFAAIACQLFGEQNQESFGNLGNSFVSMYALSTTVNNPSLWIAMFDKHIVTSLFFIPFNMFFILVNILNLSLVFDAFIRAVKIVRQRHSKDRQDCLFLACLALGYFGEGQDSFVPVEVIIRVIKLLRPRYDGDKIQALSEIFTTEQSVRQSSLLYLFPDVLSVSICKHQSTIFKSSAYRLLRVMLGGLNFIYVLLATIPYENDTFLGASFLPLGYVLTITCAIELGARCFFGRFGIFCQQHYKISFFYDSFGVAASISSIIGIILCAVEQPDLSVKGTAVNFLVIGRCIDMVRLIRGVPSFHNIVKGTKGMFSVVIGPVIVLVTSMHVFVFIGMALWGGKIVVGQTSMAPQYYDLNNFNSYGSGFFTICNILVVNDWIAIVNVFADVSPRWVIMFYFISANMILVSVLLNVVLAFFVGAFLDVNSSKEDSNSPSTEHESREHSRRDFLLKQKRHVSYDSIIHHLAEGENNFQQQYSGHGLF